MITGLAHVCLNVSDIARTIDFYEGKIGLPLKFTFKKGSKIIGAYFTISGNNFLEAFEVKDVAVKNTGITHFCLETDDIDGFMAAMKSRDVECTPKKLGCDRSWQTWLQDPDGNRFEIHQYTKESAQLNGGTVTVDW